MFFSYIDGGLGKFGEIGEDRILEVTLPKKSVKKMKNDYGRSGSADAVREFIMHQLGHGDSSWRSMYGNFGCAEVKLISS